MLSKIFVLILLTLVFVGCPDNGVNSPIKPVFALTAYEIVSTETLIKIQYASSDSITVQLKRNGQKIVQNLQICKEFLFNDTLLQPKQNFTYTAYKIENNKIVDSTPPLQISTMDTTSHEFTWETFYFGDPTASTSSLYDIAVVNDTLIYAVGEIYEKDLSGQLETSYGLTKWNGRIWYLQKLRYVTSSNNTTVFSNIRGVFRSDFNEIWFAAGSLFRWDGNSEQVQLIYSRLNFPDPNSSIEKVGGVTKNNLYAVGNIGTILYQNNSNWQKLESGTTNSIYDVWGVFNSITEKEEVYCASSDDFNPSNNRLLKITNTTKVDTVAWETGRSLYTVWTATGKTLYAAGGGLWKNNTGTWKQIDINSNSAMLRIRGNAANDIFIVGTFGLIAHYNGREWHQYFELGNASYYSVSIKNNVVAMVGSASNGLPIVTIGKRK